MNRVEDTMVILVRQDDGDLDDKVNTGVNTSYDGIEYQYERDMKEVED